MTKKILALLMAAMLVLAFSACTPAGPAAEPTPAPATDAPAADATAAPEVTAAPEDLGDIITLKYYWIGNQDSDVRPAVQDAINAHIEPKIGANIEFTIIGWGDWDNKALTALQAGEQIDIMFTADWKSYLRSVNQNLFTALNDDAGEFGNLLNTYGADIMSTINPSFVTGTQINGVNYAVPTQKELCVPMGYVYNVKAAEEVGMDPATIKTLEDFEPYFAKFKELHPDQYPYLNDGSWGDEPWVAGWVAGLNGNLLAQKYNPDASGAFDETIYSVWETEENKKHVETMYKYNQAGFINPDAQLTTYDTINSGEFAAGKFLAVSQPLKGSNIKAQELKNASGSTELELGEIYGQGKVSITTHSGGSMLAIPVTAQDPVKSMKYINLMHSDKDLVNMMLFGVPEEHWKFAEDGRVELINSAWNGAHGGAWTVGNTAIQAVTTNEDPEKNKLLAEYSTDSVSHVSLGFRYACPAELEPQWAALNNVQEAMNRALLTGAVDPAVELPKYIADLKAAGLDELKADVQKEYDAWKAAKA